MPQRSAMQITKTGHDRYRVVVNDQTAQVDESDLDGPKLEAMLRRKTLTGTTPEDVLHLLDEQEVGFQVSASYEEAL